jgi:rubredoxin
MMLNKGSRGQGVEGSSEKTEINLPLNPRTLEPFHFRRSLMTSWKCSKCGYTFQADAHPDRCPSCKEKCEFVDNTCYTPDCASAGVDTRIGPKSN